MRSAFSLLDSAVFSANGQMDSSNSLDPIRVKAVFYALCFGENAPSARAASRFVECFYTWETRTRTVDIENGDGTVTSTVEEYTVAVPSHCIKRMPIWKQSLAGRSQRTTRAISTTSIP